MTTPIVPSVTGELIAELEAESMHDAGTDIPVSAAEIRALLSERAELKRDAERYRHYRKGMACPEAFDTAIDAAMTP